MYLCSMIKTKIVLNEPSRQMGGCRERVTLEFARCHTWNGRAEGIRAGTGPRGCLGPGQGGTHSPYPATRQPAPC